MKANIEQAIGVSSFNSSVGALFLSKTTGRYLFVLRNGAKYDSMWAFVGGKVESKETEYTALQREIVEEIGFMPTHTKVIPLEIFTSNDNQFQFHTYVVVVKDQFLPKLNSEHKGYAWSKLDSWPKPLHPGVFTTFQIDEIVNKIKTIEDIMCD